MIFGSTFSISPERYLLNSCFSSLVMGPYFFLATDGLKLLFFFIDMVFAFSCFEIIFL